MNQLNDTPRDQQPAGAKHTLGNEAEVQFLAFNKSVHGKVDTGATTSSLHATKISMNQDGTQVSFHAPSLSDNIITLPIASHQGVRSADGGEQQRPVIKLEVEIEGVHVGEAEFNLNDRSGMDNELLIGQNVLKAGDFVIDVQHSGTGAANNQTNSTDPVVRAAKIKEAIKVLRDSDVTLEEMMMYIQTEAVSRIQY